MQWPLVLLYLSTIGVFSGRLLNSKAKPNEMHINHEFPGDDREDLVATKQWEQLIQGSTTCEEFVQGSTFDPKKVIDIDWRTFYFWNIFLGEDHHAIFHAPEPILLERFKSELDKSLKPPVNWDDAILFMETSLEFSALYVKTSIAGIFRVLPTFILSDPAVGSMDFALKYVEPGYLGVMNCKYRMSYALAPAENMPIAENCTLAADTLSINATVGIPYFNFTTTTEAPDELFTNLQDDDDENTHLEIIKTMVH